MKYPDKLRGYAQQLRETAAKWAKEQPGLSRWLLSHADSHERYATEIEIHMNKQNILSSQQGANYPL